MLFNLTRCTQLKVNLNLKAFPLLLLGLLITLSTTSSVFADEQSPFSAEGISLSDNQFPWQLVIDRGKILGCIYEHKFYSLGAIVMFEALPRKCELASDRNGRWDVLSDVELQQLQENIALQEKLQREATYIGKDPINEEEARLIRYVRNVKKQAETKR